MVVLNIQASLFEIELAQLLSMSVETVSGLQVV